MFSAAVVADCELRERFSRFAGCIVRGLTADPEDASAVRRNPQRFVAALLAVWPTRHAHFPGSDGAFRDQLSTLLVIREVGTSDMRPVLSKIMHDDGMSGEVAYALLTRPDRFFVGHIRRLQSAPRSVQEQLLALAVLQRMGEDTRPQLLRLQQREDISPAVRNATETLLRRFRTHQLPQWDDLFDVTSE